ncbi:hypothetical protein FA13DRAFT_1773382 [Coprinellus micaceus]|uniref:CFEM domain-containing protein n=1 Tax=Coprinellus micaceus TaxID=71717 RepID=A0A4Y7TGQ4_COPMI|nr:hypothetical protein FA13DRAFT_1773382 [Coprinellus micaceus]
MPRFSSVLIVLAAGVACAFTIFPRQEDAPDCAIRCFANSPSSCDPADNACFCKDDTFVAAAMQCILSNCRGDDLNAAVTVAQAFCDQAGVTGNSTSHSTVGTATTTIRATTSTTQTTAATSSSVVGADGSSNGAIGGDSGSSFRNGAHPWTEGVAAASIVALVLGAIALY